MLPPRPARLHFAAFDCLPVHVGYPNALAQSHMRVGLGVASTTLLLPRMRASLISFVLAIAAVAPMAAQGDEEGDRRIEAATRSALALRSAAMGGVRMHAERGIVTLTGQVEDREHRALAEQTVKAVAGVVAVDNQLELAAPEAPRGDGWIALQIRGALLVRRDVSARHTDVVVKDGVVTLSGEVYSEQEKRLTEAYARNVAGVKSVISELRVRPTNTARMPVKERPDASSGSSE